MGNSRKPMSLADILRGTTDFQQAWDAAPSTPTPPKPIPAGRYSCMVADGRLAESRSNATPGYKLVFEVVEGEYAGRKLFHDLWLTPAALPISKPILVELGMPSFEDLKGPCPALGMAVEADIVQRIDNEGRSWNEVRTFRAVEATPEDDFSPAPEPGEIDEEDAPGGAPMTDTDDDEGAGSPPPEPLAVIPVAVAAAKGALAEKADAAPPAPHGRGNPPSRPGNRTGTRARARLSEDAASPGRSEEDG